MKRYAVLILTITVSVVPIPALGIQVLDDFNDGVLSAIWNAPTTGCATIAEEGGQAVLAKPGGCAGANSLDLQHAHVVYGDFDVSVDFALNSFGTPSAGDRFTGLQVRREDNNVPIATIERYNRFNPFQDCPPATQNYKAWTTTSLNCDSSVEWLPTVDTQGKFRVTRVGSLLTMFYWSNGWQELKSATGDTGPVLVHMYAAAANGSVEAYEVRFDNFALVADVVTAVPHDSATPGKPLMSFTPNPTSGGGTVSFTLGAPDRIAITVYDVRGRSIRSIAAMTLEQAGTAYWDGRSEDGTLVGSGVYFLQIDTFGHRATSRVVVVR